MLCNEQRTGTKKKTHVKKKTLNPVFNESFVFDLPQHLEGIDEGGEGGGANSIKNISFEFQLLDWDRVTKNEVKYIMRNSTIPLFSCSRLLVA